MHREVILTRHRAPGILRKATSGLEPLTPAHYECTVSRCRGLPRVAIPAYLNGFPFSTLLRVAPYRVPGGIRVVSISRSYPYNTGTPSRPRRDARLEAHSCLSGKKPPGRVRGGPSGTGPGLCRLPSKLASILPKGSERTFTWI